MRRLTLLAAGLCVSGCALVTGPITAAQGIPFGATVTDVGVLTGECHFGRTGRIMGLLDLPLALTVDTALLPVAFLMKLPDLFDDRGSPSSKQRSDEPAPAPLRKLPKDWAERALFTHGLKRHPELVKVCGGIPPTLNLLPWKRAPDRVDIIAIGWKQNAWLRLQRWPSRERCWATEGLRTAQVGDAYFSACTWNKDGARIDLLWDAF